MIDTISATHFLVYETNLTVSQNVIMDYSTNKNRKYIKSFNKKYITNQRKVRRITNCNTERY